MTREETVKAGKPMRLDWSTGLSGTLLLSWEVWGEIRPLRAMFTVELEIEGMRRSKVAFDDFQEAVDAMEATKRKYAVDIAKTALRIRRRPV